MMMRFDAIIVGGGSAGCVAAGRLAGEHGRRVLLIEQGGNGRSPLIRVPAGLVKLMVPGSRYYTEHQSVPQPNLGGRIVPLLQAKVLGGGSALNAMTYTRGTRADYDRWDCAIGGGGWSWDDLLPYFKRQEANQRLGEPFHGTDGPLKVSDPHHPVSEISRAFLLGMQEAGLPFRSDFNDGATFGAGIIQSTTFRGERWSAARAFVEPEQGRSGLNLRLGCRVVRVMIEGGRATGVEFGPISGGATEIASADKIILAAGTLATAQLLMLSGVGSAQHLRRHGIEVHSDLPGVGQGLQDHHDVRLPFETTGNFGYSRQDRGLALLRNGLQYALFRSGPATSTGSEVTGFVNPLRPSAEPTIQFYCLGRLPKIHDAEAQHGVSLVANLIAPKSRGSIELRSADPRDLPLVDLNWLAEPDDLAQLTGGVERIFDFIETAPMRGKIRRSLRLAPTAGRQEIASYARAVTGTNWHPVGSCRMGADGDNLAVVDRRLAVRGVDGLYVFDGSIMPAIIGANTNAPIMAIADKGVDMLMGVDAIPDVDCRGAIRARVEGAPN